MIRYTGQPLPKSPRIAVVANDAIGNFVMATPLLQLLKKETHPARLVYFGGTRTEELQAGSDLFDDWANLQGAGRREFACLLERFGGEFDLVVNLESTPLSKTFVGLLAGPDTLVAGPSMGPGGRGELAFSDDLRGKLWMDKEWVAEDLPSKYPFLRSGFISEIFCRLCYLEGALPPFRVPMKGIEGAVPDILISTAASLSEKLWPLASWRELLQALAGKGRSVGLLGAARTAQGSHWIGATDEDALVEEGLVEDLRGRWPLPQVVGALAKAKAVVTLDNGILHLAVAAGTPTVGIYRHGIHRLWAPPSNRLRVLTPGEGRPVSEISSKAVWEALNDALG